MPAALSALAELQAGVLTTAQLNQLSLGSFRRLRSDWRRLSRGLWCVTEPTWSSAAWAGLLRAGSDSALGGAAALHLLGLQQSAPTIITVWLPSMSKPILVVRNWTVVFRRGERRKMGNPPRTNVEDTVLDSTAELDEDSFVVGRGLFCGHRKSSAVRATNNPFSIVGRFVFS